MQSANQPVPGKKMGHVRRQSYGKIMPISTILTNLIGSNSNHTNNTSNETGHSPLTHSFETIAMNSRVNERSDGDPLQNITDSTLDFINHEKTNDSNDQMQAIAVEPLAAQIDVNKTFLKCTNYHHRDSITEEEEEVIPVNAKLDPEDDIERVLVEDVIAPCLICSNKTTVKHGLMNVLCKKLCDDSCNTSTKTCQSNDDIVTEKSEPSTENDSDQVDKTADANQLENIRKRSSSIRQEFLASMLDSGSKDDSDDNTVLDSETHVAPLTIENLKQFNNDYFREKLAIAEALANTSMMTSSAAKQRLAARKIEMSLNTPDFVYDPENAEYIPPKELLMYLVR